MLLDSVMPPTFDLTHITDSTAAAHENNFHSFTAWLSRYDTTYGFGATARDASVRPGSCTPR
ncbi:hypothetical protein [Allokutzneria oryzae]|uniref:Uncharacterized protein n=1 Tax=Allokutzneria oryzae TaxID=1378989 RepID=A0ABV5ZX82_9PSEU